MKYIYFLSVLINLGQVLAQDSTIIFYDYNWKVISEESNAVFYRIQKTNNEANSIKVKDYWINGDIQMVGEFINDTKKNSKNGTFIYYNKDGSIDWQAEYVKGQKNGVQKEWYGVDSLKSQKLYLNGELNDTCVWYHENGKIRKVAQFNLGNEVGITKKWYDDGELASTTKFNLNNVDSIYAWYQNGERKFEGTLYETEVSNIKYDNYWSSDGEQMVENGNGYLIRENDANFWRGPIVKGLYQGKWLKYKKHKGSTWGGSQIGKMKFNKGNFGFGYIYANGKKIVIEGEWTVGPEFKNGQKGLSTYINKSIDFCDGNIIENTVYVEFVVLNTGKVSDVHIVYGKTTKCQENNIYDLFYNMPIWIPAVQNGEAVHVRYTVPISYKF